MFQLIAILSAFALANGNVVQTPWEAMAPWIGVPRIPTSGRIVGGEESSCYVHPYQASLHYFNNFRCGGMLKDRCHVITAAHCVQ